MATHLSQPSAGRLTARRRATVEEALDHAEALVRESGAGAVTVSEVARRMGMRAPSLYKYFPSLHAIYDGLFARGNEQIASFIEREVSDQPPGLGRLLVASRAMVRWSLQHTGLAPLLYWRPVPGFEPSPESFAPSQAVSRRFRSDLAAAAGQGQLAPAADSDEALRLLSVLLAGICSQHMANEPSASFETGSFSSLTDTALDMFAQFYAPTNGKAHS